MRALVSDNAGAFVARDVEEPAAEKGELVVRVEAASVGPRDLRMARARAGFRGGSDFVGTVEEGAGRSGPQTGDRVVGVIQSGAWAERIVVPASAVCRLPDAAASDPAAATAATGLTALHALERCGPLIGRKLLISGAGGAVGLIAGQLAEAGGAHVTRWSRATPAEEAGNGPFDGVIDMAGGAALAAALEALAPGGTAVVVGSASGERTSFDPARLYQNRLEIVGFALFPVLESRPAGADLARLFALIAAGRVTPPPVAPRSAFGLWAAPGAGSRTVLRFT